VYAQAAAAVGVAVPTNTLRTSTLIDGAVWDGTDPAAYAASFKIRS
jgi:nitrate/nitrite transport system substrate-binding protein